jgi:GTP1/Obg family GTP-binding protein
MKYEISLSTLVMAKQAIDQLLEAHFELVKKNSEEYDKSKDMRRRAYKASSQLDMALFIPLQQKLEITDGTTD